MNYKQTGFSIPEVAQILRVTPATIHNWISAGKISARVSSKQIVPGKKRHFRIEREHIREFLSIHREHYDIELLRAFDVAVVDPSEIPQEVKDYYKSCGDEELDSLPHRVEDLDGAWKGMFDSEANDPTPAKVYTARPEKVEQEYQQAIEGIKTYAETPKPVPCEVLVDGRISVANITKDTALAVVSALLHDPIVSVSDISIRVQK